MSPQPEIEPPVPPRVMREVERILDGEAKRLFLERLDRERLAKQARVGDTEA
jgi:hypothetical protein